MRQELVPDIVGERFVDTIQDGNKMHFEVPYGSFGAFFLCTSGGTGW